jgi:hypothetical protein
VGLLTPRGKAENTLVGHLARLSEVLYIDTDYW